MGLGSALSTALSGLNVNQNSLDVLGNNLANTNTTAFKGARNEFATNFFNTLGIGSAPGANSAGTNPRQFGQGANIGSIGVDFRPGAPNQTGVNTDLFVQGRGFFVVDGGGEILFTRDGSFRLDSQFNLVTAQGARVQGFGIDQTFTIQQTPDINSLVDLQIPLGTLNIAEETDTAFVEGILNPTGDIATQGTILDSATTTAGALAAPLPGIMVGGNSLIDDSSGGFVNPVTITYTPRKGGRILPAATAIFDPATDTMQRLADFIVGSLGINTSDTSGGNTPGATLAAGVLRINGNLGELSDFTIGQGDFTVVNNTTGAAGALNLDFPTVVQTADGESAATQFTVFNSVGEPLLVQTTAYLISAGNQQSVFNILVESPDQTIDGAMPPFPAGYDEFDRDVPTIQTLTFDATGQLVAAASTGLTVTLQDEVNNPSAAPVSFDMNYNGISALAVQNSRMSVTSQDGSPAGTLIDFGIAGSGIIVGSFSNGLTRDLGQLVLARFSNVNGLLARENNTFQQGVNSGDAVVAEPGDSVGSLLSGALELSNVDIAAQFVSLLTASNAFNANARSISTAQDLFTTLLNLPRT